MALAQKVTDFDRFLVEAIEETLKYCLGDINASIISNYLEEHGCSKCEIPDRPELFSQELRIILGSGSRQILGAASILEEAILEVLCKKIGVKFICEKPPNFPKHVRELKESYSVNVPIIQTEKR